MKSKKTFLILIFVALLYQLWEYQAHKKRQENLNSKPTITTLSAKQP
ncbi:hypothetical protein C943_04296 [Mariniradius saccharolyticus AK6]|uniref:Uncharacterized protein n=1 Tax=Mariniradius saccharolyticus AK6 TaxID=1239962 RepID=M7XZP7_9BACT|nr:hypothetical protein C943_04296 [Mariniradius saccharolyticus AK6]